MELLPNFILQISAGPTLQSLGCENFQLNWTELWIFLFCIPVLPTKLAGVCKLINFSTFILNSKFSPEFILLDCKFQAAKCNILDTWENGKTFTVQHCSSAGQCTVTDWGAPADPSSPDPGGRSSILVCCTPDMTSSQYYNHQNCSPWPPPVGHCVVEAVRDVPVNSPLLSKLSQWPESRILNHFILPGGTFYYSTTLTANCTSSPGSGMRFYISTPPVTSHWLVEKMSVFKVLEEGDCIFLLSFHGIISCHLTEWECKNLSFQSNISWNLPQ